MKSIIIVLNDSLKVYSVGDIVKQERANLEAALEKIGDSRVLNLSDRFESFWSDLDDKQILAGVKELYFVVGERAGFTDSRVVYLWLQSWKMFGEGEFWMYNETREINIGLMEIEYLNEYILNIKKNGSQMLLKYSREPRLG
jgi:hypothetical protein